MYFLVFIIQKWFKITNLYNEELETNNKINAEIMPPRNMRIAIRTLKNNINTFTYIKYFKEKVLFLVASNVHTFIINRLSLATDVSQMVFRAQNWYFRGTLMTSCQFGQFWIMTMYDTFKNILLEKEFLKKFSPKPK